MSSLKHLTVLVFLEHSSFLTSTDLADSCFLKDMTDMFLLPTYCMLKPNVYLMYATQEGN